MRRCTDLGSPGVRKERERVSNGYDRKHACRSRENHSSRRKNSNFPDPRPLKLFGALGQKERKRIALSEAVLRRHRLKPPASAQRLVRKQELFKAWLMKGSCG